MSGCESGLPQQAARANTPLERLKQALEQFGEQHDLAQTDRADKMLNITRDTGELLAVLVQTRGAQAVLEIGTSNGYSTLWLAEAVARLDGHVTTIERDEAKRALAQANFEQAGLAGRITQLAGEAGALLPTLPSAGFPLIFLDSDRRQYRAWWPQLQRLLPPRGLLVVDNAISHREELAEWMAEVAQDPRFVTSLVPVGKGEWLVVRV
ncbi:O-methyltransferase [Aeromonas jandaei]|uniref:O-methyltransferase n=1 Tax=Aeromonas jandaei TaxID=650 RepID=A0ABD7EQ27_AERJA|nr:MULTISPECIES: O-methyltransferase [Aeromonas]MBL0626364.1 O-methyltransferase [Aeromonas jandaei]MCQ4053307.1 O-methyltransferase [Aeromonas sp. SG16]QQB19634.1 O-methyltransferase [Aeromonas jandaei]QWL63280.1 O-methyltransferase [Aeromonas jandaei]UCA34310.1 O-methyltransferase [Aeromonas jandaei]